MRLRLRHFRLALCLLLASSLAACGGGSSTVKNSTTTTAASIINGSNVASLSVDSGPSTLPSSQYTVNEVFTDVTICDSEAADNCKTIDHILVDTGSTGLRIIASAIPAGLNLPQMQDASNKNIAECGMFADGYTWGPVKKATIKLADQTALSVPIQVIAEPGFNSVPTACANTGNPENDVSSFGANGVLGIGYFLQDCGTYCVKNIPAPAIYYACTSTGCNGTILATADQLNNPVSLFGPGYNNGVMLSLPGLPSNGELDVLGSLVLGVNSQSNNQLDSTQIYQVNASTGNLTTVYRGQSLTGSFIDSGSNGLYFNDSTIPGCTTATGFYCPTSTLNLSATIKDINGTQANISFNIANAETLFQSGNTAFSDLGGGGFTNTFDWGLPFFYGRKVFVVFEGQNVGGSTGPFIAF
ncbi:MAG: DUF3443 domain-containing protein [Gammaproteobacteria bacterium]